MIPDSTTLAALIASRICHDLVNPVGAMGNTADMIREADDADGRTMGLDVLDNALANALARLKLLRVALGSAMLGEGTANVQELHSVCAPYCAVLKRELDWKVTHDELPRVASRVLVNLALAALDCFVRPGTLTLSSQSGDGVLTLTAAASGPRIAMKPYHRAALGGQPGEEGFTSINAQQLYLFLLVQGARGELVARESEERIAIEARIPLTM
jgi:histidine phosphotransferase ChpT